MDIPRNACHARIHYIDNDVLERYIPNLKTTIKETIDTAIIEKILNDRSKFVPNLVHHGDVIWVGRYRYRNDMTGIYHYKYGVIDLDSEPDEYGNVSKCNEFSDIYFPHDYWKNAICHNTNFWLNSDFKYLKLDNVYNLTNKAVSDVKMEINMQNKKISQSQIFTPKKTLFGNNLLYYYKYEDEENDKETQIKTIKYNNDPDFNAWVFDVEYQDVYISKNKRLYIEKFCNYIPDNQIEPTKFSTIYYETNNEYDYEHMIIEDKYLQNMWYFFHKANNNKYCILVVSNHNITKTSVISKLHKLNPLISLSSIDDNYYEEILRKKISSLPNYHEYILCEIYI